MTRKRKWFVGVLLATLSVSCALFGVACKETEEKQATLVDFTDATVYADYKSDFSINPYLTAIDDQGGVHKGTASVVDGEGNKVELFANRFKIANVENYTATVNVTLGETDYTRTLTIDVLDKTAPVISVAQFVARKGQECAPEITVSKFEAEEITPAFKVYSILGEEATELTVTNGKFTPMNEGIHKMVVTAEDQYGGVSTLEHEFYVRSYMNVLQSFDVQTSVSDVLQSKTGANYDTEENGFYSVWHESYQGKTGVVETVTTSGGQYGMGKVALRFNRTVEELAAMQFDYISVLAWINGENGQTYQVNAGNAVLEKEVQANAWQEIRIYKEDIESEKSYWYNDTKGYQGARDWFNHAHAQDGTGDYLFNIKLPQATNPNDLTTQSGAVKIYLDSVSYANIKVSDFTSPTNTGESFTLPTAKLLDETTALLTAEYQVQAKLLGVGDLAVENNAIQIPYGGDYVITYSFFYGGITYTKEISFTVPRVLGTGVLEDFATPTSSANVRDGEKGLSTTTTSTWLASKTDGAGTEKTGVVQISLGAGKTLYFNGLLSVEEMSAMDWDYLSVWILVERSSLSQGATGYVYQWNNCNKAYANKVWTEICYTKDEINSNATVWGAKAAQDGVATGVESLYKRHSATGSGGYLFSVPSSVTDFTVYIAEISLGKNA